MSRTSVSYFNFPLLVGFVVAGYLLAGSIANEGYHIYYPGVHATIHENNACKQACSNLSDDIYFQCINDCHSGIQMTSKAHPSTNKSF